MDIFLVPIILLLVIVGMAGIFLGGLDFKKWSTWFYLLCGFMPGPIAGFYRDDILGGIPIGILAVLVIVYVSSVSRRQSQLMKTLEPRFRKWNEERLKRSKK